MSARAVVFDRDGVLTRFDLDYLKKYFEPLLPLSIAEVGVRWTRHCASRPAPRSLADEATFWRAFWEGIADDLSLTVEAREKLFAFDYTRAVAAFPDSSSALGAVRARGLRVGVLSNFPLASLDSSLAQAGLGSKVDVACSAATLGTSKPSAAAYVAIANALGVAVDECIFLDDEIECVGGARRAGMRAYWVNRRAASHAIDQSIVRDLTAIEAVLERELD